MKRFLSVFLLIAATAISSLAQVVKIYDAGSTVAIEYSATNIKYIAKSDQYQIQTTGTSYITIYTHAADGEVRILKNTLYSDIKDAAGVQLAGSLVLTVDELGDLFHSGTGSGVSADTVITVVNITAATVLDNTSFGKVHYVTGTSADYNLTLPTPGATNYGKTIGVKGGATAAFTKNVTIIGTLDGETDTRKIGADGYFLLLSDTSGYKILDEIGSWISWTPTLTGYSSLPTLGLASYFREGKEVTVIFHYTANGNSNATTKTITLPFAAITAFCIAPMLYQSAGSAAGVWGLIQTRAASNIADLYTTIVFGAWPNDGLGARVLRCSLTYQTP
jgi:hypothetical protein